MANNGVPFSQIARDYTNMRLFLVFLDVEKRNVQERYQMAVHSFLARSLFLSCPAQNHHFNPHHRYVSDISPVDLLHLDR